MPVDETPFLLPPPAPPERRTTLRVIIAASAVLHLGLLGVVARAHREQPAELAAAPPPASDTVEVLRGEVTTDTPEPGLRLHGYSRGPVPTTPRR
jgi:hypothetical protein